MVYFLVVELRFQCLFVKKKLRQLELQLFYWNCEWNRDLKQKLCSLSVHLQPDQHLDILGIRFLHVNTNEAQRSFLKKETLSWLTAESFWSAPAWQNELMRCSLRSNRSLTAWLVLRQKGTFWSFNCVHHKIYVVMLLYYNLWTALMFSPSL